MNDLIEKHFRLLLVLCAVFYLALRAVAWHNTVLLDDHDSTFYVKSIAAYHSFDWTEINGLSAYSTPFYPLLSALIAKTGLSFETSARLCSLLFSGLLFGAFYGIARLLTGKIETLAGLLILSVSPALLPISYAILTEPSYIATIYLGLLVFLLQLKRQTAAAGAVLGLIFGLAFVNRTEGILFVLIIPFMQAFYLFFAERRNSPVRQYLKWCGGFGLVFMLLAVPQIWHVSDKMGTLSVNGRIAWQLLENSDVGQNSKEKQYGLYFRKDETNIEFARKNYHEAKAMLHGMQSDHGGTDYLGRATNNIQEMARIITGSQLGRIGSLLALAGILGLFLSGRRIETFLVLGFAAGNLAGPLLHADHIYARHLLAAAPALLLFQAVGTVYVAARIAAALKVRWLDVTAITVVLLAVSMLYAVKPLYHAVIKPPVANYGYSIEELREPLRLIREISESQLQRKPVIAARSNYVAYYSGAETLYLPYAGYQELVEYLDANNADFLYLRYSSISGYPFLEAFEGESSPPRLSLLFRGVDAHGGRIELYRFTGKVVPDGL
ncbi:MAG: glycosyltransferase family 39 protein [Thiogranum sp.]|nr:glycosyltransferase family 39 protein [Thiogranum sp.]